MSHPTHPSAPLMPRESKREREPAAIEELDSLIQSIHHHLERPYEFMRREIELFRSIVSNINLVLAVGAFIAGVQTSVLSSTRLLSSGIVQRTANWFAYVGLTLDILGTSTGVVRSITLQRAITRTERTRTLLAGDATRIQEHATGLKARCQRTSEHPEPTLSPEDATIQIQHAVNEFHRHRRICQKFQDFYELVLPVHTLRHSAGSRNTSGTTSEFPTRSRSKSLAFAGVGTMVEVGLNTVIQGLADILPIAALGAGLICLLVSVILLAVGSQPREVWIACTVVAGVAVIGGSLPIMVDVHYSQREQLLHELDEYSRQRESGTDGLAAATVLPSLHS